jgi:hypothetical protein
LTRCVALNLGGKGYILLKKLGLFCTSYATYEPIVDYVLISSTSLVRVVDNVAITGEEFPVVINGDGRELLV